MEGYDPVSYFDGVPLEGNPNIKLVYKNLTYQFASMGNQAKFKLAPEKYEPPTEDGVHLLWENPGKKLKLIPKPLRF